MTERRARAAQVMRLTRSEVASPTRSPIAFASSITALPASTAWLITPVATLFTRATGDRLRVAARLRVGVLLRALPRAVVPRRLALFARGPRLPRAVVFFAAPFFVALFFVALFRDAERVPVRDDAPRREDAERAEVFAPAFFRLEDLVVGLPRDDFLVVAIRVLQVRKGDPCSNVSFSKFRARCADPVLVVSSSMAHRAAASPRL